MLKHGLSSEYVDIISSINCSLNKCRFKKLYFGELAIWYSWIIVACVFSHVTQVCLQGRVDYILEAQALNVEMELLYWKGKVLCGGYPKTFWHNRFFHYNMISVQLWHWHISAYQDLHAWNAYKLKLWPHECLILANKNPHTCTVNPIMFYWNACLSTDY